MKKISVLFLALIPSILSAHSGHGSLEGLSLMHYLESPVHILPLIALLLVGIIVWRKSRLVRE